MSASASASACAPNVYVSYVGVGHSWGASDAAVFRFDGSTKVPLPTPPSGWTYPKGLVVDKFTKDVFVSDYQRVVKIPGGTDHPIAITDPRFTSIADVFIDSRSTLWILNKGYDPTDIGDGAAANVYTSTLDGANFSPMITSVDWGTPQSITVSPAGVVFVSDWTLNGGGPAIVKIDAYGAGAVSYIIDDNSISQPTGLWLSPAGDLFVGEFNNVRLSRTRARPRHKAHP